MPSLVVVSHPEKVLFPDSGVTKGEVADYYHRVADVMLPHLIDRPLTIQRFPQGIQKQGFMQKHAGKGFPDYIDRIELAKQDGTVKYPVVRDEKGLAYLANQNTITFHIPGFRASHLEHPDRMVFDLDPSEGDLDGVRYSARATAEFLGALDVPTWLMTSGSKGFHLVTDLQPTISFDEMGRFAQAVATLLAESHPSRMTVEFLKKERKGRVFVDWMRNHFGPTAVCPYSLRPRPGAPIAMPIDWSDLETTAPDQFRLRAFEFDASPWAAAKPIDLAPAVAAMEEMIVRSGVELPEFDRFGRT
ncbi:MAG TPA: non-homologous end-joining DNA ligase [Acidimicrobiia bacterium]|nr:non-homologous end-joining DNA ligase [Acidimicrobiia bacterium]